VKNIGTADGESISFNLTENLIQDIGYISQLRTPGFNEVLQFKDSEMGRDDIGRQLKVENVLNGNILKEGDTLRLNFELLNLNDGTIIWQESWTDLISNNKKIRRHILQNILSKFDLEMPEQLIKSYSEELTENKEALEVYYKGKYCSDILKSNKDLEDAKNYLDSAITLDNTFVTAYAEYALACQRLGFFDEAESSLNKGEKYAEKSNDNQGLSGIYNGFYTLYSSWGKYAKAHDYIKKALTIQITLQNNLMETRLRLNYANLLNHLQEPILSLEQNSQANRLLVELEEDRLLGISHAVMTNTYFVLGDYSESVKNGILSLGLFRKIEMSSYEGKILVVIADSLSKMGDFDRMDSYIQKAEPIVTLFNDTLLMAKIDFLKGESALNKGDIQSAIDFTASSIDTAELAEHRNFLTKALLNQIRLYIEDGRLEKAEKLISKMEIQLKKIADSANQPLLFSMKLLVDTLNGNSKVEEINSFQNTLKDNDNPGNEHVNWYLARSYKILNEDELAKNLQDKAKNTINTLAEKISDEKDRKYYHDIYFHKRIMEELEDGKTKTEEKPETPSVFGFCPGCGFKNENSFVFCPSCGNDLKQ
jgi:tetratricopeptide (TPR) repeat protein